MKSVAALHLMLALLVSCVWVCGAAKGFSGNKGLQRETPVNPKLDPDSHKLFFGKDYPDDDASKHMKPTFGHPYPALQDTSDYDKDYVKDENHDDGEWKAQMTYDLLRTKISKTHQEYIKAKQSEEDIRSQVDTAQKNEANAAQATRDAEKRAATAKETVERAQEAQRRLLAEGASGSGEGDAEARKAQAEVDAAMDAVKKEIKDLEGCRAELEAAREELRRLLAKEEERQAEANNAQAQVKLLVKQNEKLVANETMQQQQTKTRTEGKSMEGTNADQWGKESLKQKTADEVEQRELQQGEVEAQAAVLEARAREFEAEEARQKAEQAELARKAADEEARHREAQVQFEDQKRDLQHTSDELSQAAAKLKAYRHDDANSGSLRKPVGNIKNGATPANFGALPPLMMMSLVTIVFLQ